MSLERVCRILGKTIGKLGSRDDVRKVGEAGVREGCKGEVKRKERS